MKKLLTYVLSILIAVAAPLTVSGDYRSDLLLSYDAIVDIVFTKNPEDLDTTQYIKSNSLPFTITVLLSEEVRGLPSSTAVLLLDNCSFYPSQDRIQYAYYDSAANSFTFNNILYSGEDQRLTLVYMDSSLYKTFFFDVNIALPNSSTSSSGNSAATKAEDLPASLKPHLLVGSYGFDDTILENVPFTVDVELINTSDSAAIENAVISFTPRVNGTKSNNFQIINSTDTKYLQFLGPGETITYQFQCILEEINSTVHTIEMEASYQYYDIEGEDPINGSDSVALNISTPRQVSARLEKIGLPNEIYAGKAFSLNYRVVNTGQLPLRMVDLSVQDSSGQDLSRTFIGTIDAGEAVTEPAIEIILPQVGTYTLIFTVFYFDAQSEATEQIDFSFPVAVTPPPVDVEAAESEETEAEGGLGEEEETLSEIPKIIVSQEESVFDNTAAVVLFVITALGGTGYAVYVILFSKKNKGRSKTISVDDFQDTP